MSKRSKVAYSGMGGEEPSFLKAFKAKVGYQERGVFLVFVSKNIDYNNLQKP